MVFHLLIFIVFYGSSVICRALVLVLMSFLATLISLHFEEYIEYSKILTLRETDVNYTIKFSDNYFYD